MAEMEIVEDFLDTLVDLDTDPAQALCSDDAAGSKGAGRAVVGAVSRRLGR